MISLANALIVSFLVDLLIAPTTLPQRVDLSSSKVKESAGGSAFICFKMSNMLSSEVAVESNFNNDFRSFSALDIFVDDLSSQLLFFFF